MKPLLKAFNSANLRETVERSGELMSEGPFHLSATPITWTLGDLANDGDYQASSERLLPVQPRRSVLNTTTARRS